MAADPTDPRLVFAGTEAAGLFRSRDGGVTWEAVSGLPGQVSVTVVAFDPRRPRTLYVGLGGQSFKSLDRGVSWTLLAGGPFDGPVFSLTFAPRRPEIVYAWSGHGMFRSADGGVTWDARVAPFGQTSLGESPIVVSPFDADTLFLDAYLSTDGGRSWTFLSPNFFAAEATGRRVLFDPLNPGVVLYAALNLGVFRSQNGGHTWSDVTPRHPTAEYLLENMAFSADGGTLFVAADFSGVTFFQESRDSGRHWTQRSTPAPFQLDQYLRASIVADPAGRQRLYATTAEGIYWSADGGQTWEGRSDGLVAGGVVDLLADSQIPGTRYAVNSYGALSRSRNGGATWHFLRGGIADRLTADPTHAGTFYSGLLRFTAEGESWTPLPFSFSLYCLSSAEMVVDPVSPSTLYLMAQSYTGYGCHFGDLGLFKSSDGSLTWEDFSTAPVIANLAFGAPRQTLYGETYAGAARSGDGGKTWSESNAGLPSALAIDSFALSPDSARLYLSGGSRQGPRSVFRSEDGTRTWQQVAPIPLATDEPFLLVADPHVPTTVYGHGGGRFFRSVDGGVSWTEFGAGLKRFQLTGPLLLDPHRPGVVLGGTASGLVIEIELP